MRVIGEGVVESEAGGKEVLLSSLRVVDRKTLASRKLKEYLLQVKNGVALYYRVSE